jgi:hypothetical protein
MMNANPEFLTVDECGAVDAALLTAHGRFNARVAIYALRSLKQIATTAECAIAALKPETIVLWVESDPTVQSSTDESFRGFWAKLVLSAISPLNQAAAASGSNLENLTVPQVIQWFEQQAKHQLSE